LRPTQFLVWYWIQQF